MRFISTCQALTICGKVGTGVVHGLTTSPLTVKEVQFLERDSVVGFHGEKKKEKRIEAHLPKLQSLPTLTLKRRKKREIMGELRSPKRPFKG